MLKFEDVFFTRTRSVFLEVGKHPKRFIFAFPTFSPKVSFSPSLTLEEKTRALEAYPRILTCIIYIRNVSKTCWLKLLRKIM